MVPTNREIDMTSINRTFLTITCAAATMMAILLVSSGDALAKVSRAPDTGGEIIKRKSTPGCAS